MGQLTVDQIMQQIAATVNQESSAPTGGGAEWSLWLSFINRSVEEWARAFDWEELRKTYIPQITGTAVATVSMPADFSRLAAAPVRWDSGLQGGEEIKYISTEDRKLYSPYQKWVQVWGNISSGYNLVFNPGTLSSGASLSIQYFAAPTSLASPANIPVVPDSQFIVDRVVSYILEARSDPRFQQQEVKAREKLLAMIEDANMRKYNSFAGSSPIITSTRRAGFRMGRD